jgi:hypothetical protein
MKKLQWGFLRITQSSWLVTRNMLSTRGSQGVPAYGAVHLMSSSIPHQGSNKADALSAELQGHMPSAVMLTRWRVGG